MGEEVLSSRDLADRRCDSMDTSMLDYYDGRMDVGPEKQEVKMDLTRADKENIIMALNMRKNYIQTGDMAISAVDAERMGKGVLVKALTTEQMRLIIRTEELIATLRR